MRVSLLFLIPIFLVALVGTSHATLVSMTINQYYDFENDNVSASNNGLMDIQCAVTNSGLVAAKVIPVNTAAGLASITNISTNLSNAYGYQWGNGQQFLRAGANSKYFVIYTNEDNYIKVFDGSSSDGKCEFNSINHTQFGDTTRAYRSAAFAGTIPTVNTTGFEVNDTTSVMIDSDSMGWAFSNDTYNFIGTSDPVYKNMDTYYDVYNSVVTGLNNSRFSDDRVCPNTISDYLDCSPGPAAKATLALFSCPALWAHINPTLLHTGVVAGPPYWYYTCVNTSTGFGAYVNNYTRLDLGNPNSVRPDFRLYLSLYNATTFDVITNVVNSPSNPQANTSVLVTFSSGLPNNSTVFFRYRNVTAGNGLVNYSTFIAIINNSINTSHSVYIPAQFIYDAKYYQYYVQSGPTTVNNNSDQFYNFTVGILGTDPNAVGLIPNYVLPSLEGTGFCAGSNCLYIFGALLLIVYTFPALIFGGIRFGVNVLVAGVIIESVIGLLPLVFVLPFVIFVIVKVVTHFNVFGKGSD